jgi:hypothetical protein
VQAFLMSASITQAGSFVVEELLLLRIQLACHGRVAHHPGEASPEKRDRRTELWHEALHAARRLGFFGGSEFSLAACPQYSRWLSRLSPRSTPAASCQQLTFSTTRHRYFPNLGSHRHLCGHAVNKPWLSERMERRRRADNAVGLSARNLSRPEAFPIGVVTQGAVL